MSGPGRGTGFGASRSPGAPGAPRVAPALTECRDGSWAPCSYGWAPVGATTTAGEPWFTGLAEPEGATTPNS